jgi:tetratricopeptide (TPR) repeat protein
MSLSKVVELESFGERFGAHILKLRTDNVETQQEVADGAFGDPSAKSRISALENGKLKRPQAKTVNAICAYFDISATELAELRRPKPQPISQPHSEALEKYARQLESDLAASRAKLEDLALVSRKALLERIDVLEQRLADPESALTEAEKTVEELRIFLDRDGNELGGPLLARARDALAHLDYRKAEAVLEEIEGREALALARAARAAYARGVVAELDVRWADAANHFGRAAGLSPTSDRLRRAGECCWLSDNYDQAIGYASQWVELCRESSSDHDLALALDRYATYLQYAGAYLRAEILFLEARKKLEVLSGGDHSDYASILNNLGLLYIDMERYMDAEPLLIEAIRIGSFTIGESDRRFAERLNNLALLYDYTKNYPAAEELYKRALAIDEISVGVEHPEYAKRIGNLGDLYREMKRYPDAEKLLLEARQIALDSVGPNHTEYARHLNNLARLYEDSGQTEKAISFIEDSLNVVRSVYGEAHPKIQHYKKNYDRIVSKFVT